MKNFCKVLVVTIVFNTMTSTSELPDNSHLQGNISYLLLKLFPPEQTLHLVYENSENHNQLVKIPNPYTVTKINKPIRGSLHSSKIYIIFTTNNQTSLNQILTKIQESCLWNRSNSPRGRFVIVTSNNYTNRRSLTDQFNKRDIIDFFLVQEIQNKTEPFEQNAISDFSEPESTYRLCFTSIHKIKEQEMKLILPFSVNISTTKRAELKAIFSLALENLNIIGNLFKMKVSYLFANDTKPLLYKNSDDVYILLSANRNEQLYKDYDVCNYFYRDTMVWAVPIPDKMSTFKTIATTLDQRVWLIIIILLITKSVLWWLFSKLFKNKIGSFDLLSCILTSFVITLGGSYNLLPKRKSLLFLFLFYLIYSMQISTVFQGKLFSGLTEPKMEQGITTIVELADSPLPMIGNEDTKSLMREHFSNHPVFKKVLKKLVIQSPIDLSGSLMNMARFKNCSTLIGKRALLYALPQFKRVVNLIELNTGVLEFEPTFAVRKGHHLFTVLNKFCRRLIEGGIDLKLFSDATAAYSHKEIVPETGPFAFGIYHLNELFILWAIGILLSTFVFVLEMCGYYCVRYLGICIK